MTFRESVAVNSVDIGPSSFGSYPYCRVSSVIQREKRMVVSRRRHRRLHQQPAQHPIYTSSIKGSSSPGLSSSSLHRFVVLVPAHAKLLLDLLQLGHQAFSSRLPPDTEVALPVLAAIMRKPQKIEGLRFSFPPPPPTSLGPTAELDQSRLVHVQFQSELRQSIGQLLTESLSVVPILQFQSELRQSIATRVGELRLKIPQVRGLSFYPQSLEKGCRSEKALKLAVAEMYVMGLHAQGH